MAIAERHHALPDAVWALSVMELLTPALRKAFQKHLHHACMSADNLSSTAMTQLVFGEVLYQCGPGGACDAGSLVERLEGDCIAPPEVQHTAVAGSVALVKEKAAAARAAPSPLQVGLSSSVQMHPLIVR
jgi:hypothetical protein